MSRVNLPLFCFRIFPKLANFWSPQLSHMLVSHSSFKMTKLCKIGVAAREEFSLLFLHWPLQTFRSSNVAGGGVRTAGLKLPCFKVAFFGIDFTLCLELRRLVEVGNLWTIGWFSWDPSENKFLSDYNRAKNLGLTKNLSIEVQWLTWIVNTGRVTFFFKIFSDSNWFNFWTFDFFEATDIWHSTQTRTSSWTDSGTRCWFCHFDWFFDRLLAFKRVTWSKRIEWTTWSGPTWCWRKSSRNESFRITRKIESVHHWIMIFWFVMLWYLVFPDNPECFQVSNDFPSYVSKYIFGELSLTFGNFVSSGPILDWGNRQKHFSHRDCISLVQDRCDNKMA